MKFLLPTIAGMATLATATKIPCPAGFQPGDRWCQTPGVPSDILYCTRAGVGEAISRCPGRCQNRGRSAYCEYRGWDDTCEKNPDYNVWCEKDGGPSGVRVCIDGHFPVTSLCEGICNSNGGHAICWPEGFQDKCPEGVREGQSYCDELGGPSKIRTCKDGTYAVTDNCKDICDGAYGNAKCLTKIH